MTTLVYFPGSPWSERVRWALDHHGIERRDVVHVPMLGEPLLRWRMRKPFDRVTVPILIAPGARIGESLEIARWAEAHGRGPTLFPKGREAECLDLNALSDEIVEAGRPRVTSRVAASPEARLEAVPPPLRVLGRVAGAMAGMGTQFVLRKYQGTATRDELLEVMRHGLVEVRRALGGNPYALGAFSYADIALALAIQPVMPVADCYIRLGPATRAAWTEPELVEEFADLVAWRDALFDSHRRQK